MFINPPKTAQKPALSRAPKSRWRELLQNSIILAVESEPIESDGIPEAETLCCSEEFIRRRRRLRPVKLRRRFGFEGLFATSKTLAMLPWDRRIWKMECHSPAMDKFGGELTMEISSVFGWEIRYQLHNWKQQLWTPLWNHVWWLNHIQPPLLERWLRVGTTPQHFMRRPLWHSTPWLPAVPLDLGLRATGRFVSGVNHPMPGGVAKTFWEGTFCPTPLSYFPFPGPVFLGLVWKCM